MSLLLSVLGLATLLLTLKAIGVRNLSEDELAELNAVECPVCRKNLETIKAACGLWRGLRKVQRRAARRVSRVLLPHVKGSAERIERNPNSGAASHS
ncbi:MAG TPA: hypothetical protein VN256_23825 [Pyrinomonadaceae bacterium]|nr:hypothetical protein [Pyrinomonadaceae bacterium]